VTAIGFGRGDGPAARSPIRPDLRLVPAAVASWAVAFVATGTPASGWIASAVALAASAVAAFVGRRGSSRRPGSNAPRLAIGAMAALACASATGAAGAWRGHVVQDGPVALLAAQHASGTASLVLSSDPAPLRSRVVGDTLRPNQVFVRARLEHLRTTGSALDTRLPVLVFAPAGAWHSLLPSQRVTADVRLAPAMPGDESAATLTVRGPPRNVGPPSTVQRVAGVVRDRLRQATSDLSPEQGSLVTGLVDGDTARMPPVTSDEFRAAGLSHLTAVSGANVALVLAAVLLLSKWVGLRGRLLPLTGALALAAFLVVARPDPSVVRASTMGVIALAAMARGGMHGRPPVPPLAAAVVILLFVDPFLSRSPGFALSVLATAGLIVLAPGWRDALGRHLPNWLATALAVALAAQAAVLPVLVLLAPTVSLVALPANLLAAPAVPVATVLGAICALLSLGWMWGGTVVAHVAGYASGWIVGVAHVCAGLPGGTVGWPPGLFGASLMIVALGSCRLAIPWCWRHRRASIALGAAVLLVLRIPASLRPNWPPPGWLAVACDVGQGDALVVAAGANQAVVVDSGPDPNKIDSCLRDLGISRVVLVVLTHFHADHAEGLPGVLRNRSVAEIEVSPLAEPAAEVRRVRGWAAEAGVPVKVAADGEQRAVGGVDWRVLWPARIIRGQGSDPNNASIVLRFDIHGVVLLLTGDVEPAAQEALLRRDPNALRANVLKVPHHGSAHQDPDLLRAVGATFALISVGAGNTYGHPSRTTIDLLRSAGTQVDRTDTEGALAVVGSADSLRVVPERGPP